MTEQRLVVVIMGQNCERFIDMCLNSVKDADTIVYCDGGSTDKTIPFVDNFFLEQGDNRGKIIENTYNQADKGMNGKQRNFYLEHVKKNYPGWWCLALDADEVVEDLSKLKDWINKYDSVSKKYPCLSVKMRHFIGDLGHEDATTPEHFVPNRLFKIENDLYYPEVEHPVLQSKSKQPVPGYAVRDTTIWHLAYIPNLWDIKKRYDNHLAKSNMHTPEYLKSWYFAHLFGKYPKSEINLTDIPESILRKFNIDKDEFYFANRGIDLKHSMMVKQWNDYFKPESVLDLGCGRGPYLYFWYWYCNHCLGIELSQWAVDNRFCDTITQGDITEEKNYSDRDLITAIDVLEHLDDKQLNEAMNNITRYGKRFLISVPVVGDPNLMNDKTHKQFKTREEWLDLFSNHGIKILPTPDDWLFKDQLFIGVKKEKV